MAELNDLLAGKTITNMCLDDDGDLVIVCHLGEDQELRVALEAVDGKVQMKGRHQIWVTVRPEEMGSEAATL